ncbi:hypothetical protein ACHWQZ_G003095, partial [Mnemiopsis leidyi]
SKVTIHRETNDVSLQHDRYACAVKRIKDGRGLLVPQLVTVGNIPYEVSKYCHYFMCHSGESNGVVDDSRHSRSPIPSGGLAVKLKLTFKGLGDIVFKMKQLIRESYCWEYTREQRETKKDEEIDL